LENILDILFQFYENQIIDKAYKSNTLTSSTCMNFPRNSFILLCIFHLSNFL
jgi:hypothetical protein